MTNTFGFGFDGETPVQCSVQASILSYAMFTLIDARDELTEAKKNVPSYTGQWNCEDYYADELEAYHRASDKFAAAVSEHLTIITA